MKQKPRNTQLDSAGLDFRRIIRRVAIKLDVSEATMAATRMNTCRGPRLGWQAAESLHRYYASEATFFVARTALMAIWAGRPLETL